MTVCYRYLIRATEPMGAVESVKAASDIVSISRVLRQYCSARLMLDSAPR